MRHLVLIASVLVGLGSPVLAQAPGQTPPITYEPAATPTSQEKSPATAVALSVGVTLGGIVVASAADNDGGAVLGLAALYFGPSVGQWYGGEVGWIGLGARALGGVLFIKGISAMDNGGCEAWYTDSECSAVEDEQKHGENMMWLGAGLWLGSTAYDFYASGRAASRWNKKHALQVAPLTANGTTGAVVSMRF